MRHRWKDVLIPHEGNDYTPHSLQTAAVYGMAILVVLSFAIANLQSVLWINSDWLVSSILPSVIVEETNEERDSEALTSLRRSATLDAAAQMKAEHMAQNQYFAHYSPTGISPWHWFNIAEYEFVHAGENLAIHFTDSAAVVRAWMNSPAHRANILSDNYTDIGVGAARGEYEGYQTVFVVQLFGTPSATQGAAERLERTQTDLEQVALNTNARDQQNSPTVAGVESGEDSDVARERASGTQHSRPIRSAEVISEVGASETEIVNVASTTDTISLYSGTISTSTGGIPATTDGSMNESTPAVSIVGLATQPQTVLQVLYGFVALFVVIALSFATFFEIRRQHPIQLIYSVGLIVTMARLLHVHLTLTAGVVIAS